MGGRRRKGNREVRGPYGKEVSLAAHSVYSSVIPTPICCFFCVAMLFLGE